MYIHILYSNFLIVSFYLQKNNVRPHITVSGQIRNMQCPIISCTQKIVVYETKAVSGFPRLLLQYMFLQSSYFTSACKLQDLY